MKILNDYDDHKSLKLNKTKTNTELTKNFKNVCLHWFMDQGEMLLLQIKISEILML